MGPFKSMRLYLGIVSPISWVPRALLRMSLSANSFFWVFHVKHWDLWSICNGFVCRAREKNRVSHFHLPELVFPALFFKVYFSPGCIFWGIFFQNKNKNRYVFVDMGIYVCVPNSNSVYCVCFHAITMLFLQLRLCSITWKQWPYWKEYVPASLPLPSASCVWRDQSELCTFQPPDQLCDPATMPFPPEQTTFLVYCKLK